MRKTLLLLKRHFLNLTPFKVGFVRANKWDKHQYKQMKFRWYSTNFATRFIARQNESSFGNNFLTFQHHKRKVVFIKLTASFIFPTMIMPKPVCHTFQSHTLCTNFSLSSVHKAPCQLSKKKYSSNFLQFENEQKK